MEPGDMYVGREFVTVEKCPKHETCSAQAWKRAAVWGWDRTECEGRLLSHLEKSSLHAGEFSAEGWTAQMEVHHYDGYKVMAVTEADMVTASSPTQAASAKRKTDSSTPMGDQAIDAAATKIMERMEKLRARQQPSTPPRGGQSSRAPTVIGLHPTQLQIRARVPQQLPFQNVAADTVRVRISELQQCADACFRAAQAAKHAQRLSASAAQAFGNEAQTLEQCGEIMKTLMEPTVQHM
jgi:hypothetical protein